MKMIVEAAGECKENRWASGAGFEEKSCRFI